MWEGYVYSLCFSTVPLLLLDSLLFYMLACPCVRFERQGRAKESKWRRTEWVVTTFGHLALLPVLVVALLFVFLAAWACASGRGAVRRQRRIDGRGRRGHRGRFLRRFLGERREARDARQVRAPRGPRPAAAPALRARARVRVELGDLRGCRGAGAPGLPALRARARVPVERVVVHARGDP